MKLFTSTMANNNDIDPKAYLKIHLAVLPNGISYVHGRMGFLYSLVPFEV